MYKIHNISKKVVIVDGILIAPYESKEFPTINNRLDVNKYTNRHQIKVVEIKPEPINTVNVTPINTTEDVVTKPTRGKKKVVEDNNDEVGNTKSEDERGND